MTTIHFFCFVFSLFLFFLIPCAFSALSVISSSSTSYFLLSLALNCPFHYTFTLSFLLSFLLNGGSEESLENSVRPLSVRRQVILILLSVSINRGEEGWDGTEENALLQHGTVRDRSCRRYNPYPTAFPYGNGMVLHFYQQQESSTTKTVHKVINKGLKTYV